MERRKLLTTTIFISIVFTYLFFNHSIGLNLLLFNLVVVTALFYLKKVQLKGVIEITLLLGVILTSVFSVVHNSALVIIVNILTLFLLSGILLLPQARNLFFTSGLSFINLFMGQIGFYRLIEGLGSERKGVRNLFRYFRIFIFPIIIFIVFLLIYKFSNPFFGEQVQKVFLSIENWFSWLLNGININLVFTWVLGLLVANFIFLGTADKSILKYEQNGNFQLIRKKNKLPRFVKTNALKNEFRAGVALFAMLNILLLVVNAFDIVNVWFGFEWNGNYLKQFVHEGTYLLIFSIIISLVVTLYFFRGNLNFYSRNRSLRILANIWLWQNAILVISVGIRNFWYIHYFALAYKRIGVIFFLVFTLVCIVLVLIKVNKRKSIYFLFAQSALAFYIVLISMSLFNWDTIIARYNFSHYQTAFVHLDFLSGLSDKSLPYLIKTPEELNELEEKQKTVFRFNESYMTTNSYDSILQLRKQEFLSSWPQKDWLEWNLADSRSYKKLME